MVDVYDSPVRVRTFLAFAYPICVPVRKKIRQALILNAYRIFQW